MTPQKIADDPVYGEIRAAICDAYIAAGQPTPEKDWLYSQLVAAHAQLREVATALGHAAALADAIRPLIPPRDSLAPEKQAQWQAVVNAIYRGADHADRTWPEPGKPN